MEGLFPKVYPTVNLEQRNGKWFHLLLNSVALIALTFTTHTSYLMGQHNIIKFVRRYLSYFIPTSLRVSINQICFKQFNPSASTVP